ncbi:hypothetical protein [Chryseolinea sp. H1M3-3]|uniref:hypothetical protein n=1 Tax=Chryseolinea sp. H1M3-3 TaxID=3034144 RepID=UPI0023EAB764|nr:hypothetical protein [Chryseolinea sp. H1M3-3]
MTRNLNILIGTTFLILTWIFVGIFRDDEFYEPTIFIKHRPTFKVNFYSPIGMSDLQLKDLTMEKQKELLAFDEFVIKEGIQYNSNDKLWYLPFVLIQITLTSFTFGILNSKAHKIWRMIFHFSICIFPTTFGLVFILAFDRIFMTISLGLLIVGVNCLILYLLTRQRKPIEIAS